MSMNILSVLIAAVAIQSAPLEQIGNTDNVITGITGTASLADTNYVNDAIARIPKGLSTNDVKSISATQVTNDVAPWAMKGQDKPQGMGTNDVQSIVDSAVGGTNAVKSAVTDVATIKADYLTKSATNDFVKADITNGLASAQSVSNSTNALHSVAHSGNYNDLSNKPTVVNSVNGESGSVTVTPAKIGAATTQQLEATQAIVYTWEGFLDGSNVVFSITNYISGTYRLDAAKFRVLEMTNGFYREIYNSRTEILMHIDNFKDTDFRVATNSVIQSVDAKIADKADKEWGKYTSSGTTIESIGYSNTVYMTAPNTVFAGGMEYERVAVGEGVICVLTTKGAPVYTQGDEGTFKFQSDGGTNYFGFAKTDSYVIGANASGISVQNHIVTITYDVTMPGVPCIWYKLHVQSADEWEQLNLSDGTAVPGASHIVSWEQNPPEGKRIAYVNCQEAQGFFRATIEVPGSAKFISNMPADFSAGVLCTDGSTIIYPHADGTWSTTK